jgi:hypothetical protein
MDGAKRAAHISLRSCEDYGYFGGRCRGMILSTADEFPAGERFYSDKNDSPFFTFCIVPCLLRRLCCRGFRLPQQCLKTSSPAWESQEGVGLRLSELLMVEGGRGKRGGFYSENKVLRGGIFRSSVRVCELEA